MTATARDEADPLARFRELFVATDPDLIYLDGNSLGRLPVATATRIEQVVSAEWGSGLVRSWPELWWPAAQRTGDLIADITGSGRGNVIIAESTSVVLFKLAVAALEARPGRATIITDDLNFPGDSYILRGAADLLGRRVRVIPSTDGVHGPISAIEAALDDDVALLSLSHVTFKSGYLYDMKRLTQAARQTGALTLWDLSHSVGAVPMDLLDSDVDLAVGCTYKYLNGGPGSPAFLFCNPAEPVDNPIPGWWGHAEPFAFDRDFAPDPGIRRFLTGTMPILSLAALEPALEIVLDAQVDAIRAKSIALSEFFLEKAEENLVPLGFAVASPRESDRRGSHVSLRHDDGWRITRAMIEDAHIVPDFRDPDNIRFGFAPLYTTFTEIDTAVERIRDLVVAGRHRAYDATRSTVT